MNFRNLRHKKELRGGKWISWSSPVPKSVSASGEYLPNLAQQREGERNENLIKIPLARTRTLHFQRVAARVYGSASPARRAGRIMTVRPSQTILLGY